MDAYTSDVHEADDGDDLEGREPELELSKGLDADKVDNDDGNEEGRDLNRCTPRGEREQR
jgi:hypothetical protein